VNVTDEDGDTPLYVVENVETARFLVEHGAVVQRTNHEGRSVRVFTPLFNSSSNHGFYLPFQRQLPTQLFHPSLPPQPPKRPHSTHRIGFPSNSLHLFYKTSKGLCSEQKKREESPMKKS